MAGLQDWLGGKARSGLDAYLAWRDGPSAVQRLDEAFPQAEPQPGKSVAEVAPPRTSLSPEQWDALGNFNWSATFGGEGAATADLGALAKAKALATEGHDPRSVWGQTGWFKGPEDRWKFEIDDSESRIGKKAAEDFLNNDAMSGKAPAVLWHKDLYAAYPGLRQLPVSVSRTKGYSPSFEGSYAPSGGIKGQAIGTGASREMLLHELQHAVQGREGFAPGGSEYHGARVVNVAQDEASRLRDIFSDKNMGFLMGEVPREEVLAAKQAADAAAGHADALSNIGSDFDRYRHLAGEAEARAVQARAGMTPEQRRATFPLDSYDVPLDRLITRKPGWFPG